VTDLEAESRARLREGAPPLKVTLQRRDMSKTAKETLWTGAPQR